MAGGTADENSWQTRSQFRTPLFVLSIIIKPICLITILIRTRLNRDFLFNSLPLTVSIEQRERERRRRRGKKGNGYGTFVLKQNNYVLTINGNELRLNVFGIDRVKENDFIPFKSNQMSEIS